MSTPKDSLEREFNPESASGNSAAIAARLTPSKKDFSHLLRQPKHWIDAVAEDKFWRDNFRREAYFNPAYNYEDYGPAFRSGYMEFSMGIYESFDDAEPRLRLRWEDIRDRSVLTWERAKPASRAAWLRVEKAAIAAGEVALEKAP